MSAARKHAYQGSGMSRTYRVRTHGVIASTDNESDPSLIKQSNILGSCSVRDCSTVSMVEFGMEC